MCLANENYLTTYLSMSVYFTWMRFKGKNIVVHYIYSV